MEHLINKTIEFVRPYYDVKDVMHGWAHIERILKLALEISEKYEADKNLIKFGAYFHGVIWKDEKKVREFLITEGVEDNYIEKIIGISWDSQKESSNDIEIEGKILHDAHLLEGGKTFIVAKTLVTGTARGQSFEETIKYMKDNVLDKYACYFPENQKLYQEKEDFAKDFITDLENNL